MKKVIDANFFQIPELEDYLKSNIGNMVVFPDFACMEAYKGNAIKNISKSIEIISRYPDHVIVLKGTRDVIKQTLVPNGYQKLEDTDQTQGFKIFCLGVYIALRGDVTTANQILEKGKLATNHFDKMQKDAALVAKAIEERAKSFKPTETIDKIIKEILLLTALLFKKHPDVYEMPQTNQVPNSYIFRFAVCAYLLMIRWISDGGIGNVGLDKLRNDTVDMNYVAYATFYDGLLTNDKKMMEIYQEACFILENTFNTKPGGG
ncbi:MAG TPA: hypothetical protein ENH23_02145 [candidate division Zixibacteria bacterium]|nr:hypothetical protein [candidate division Zixibacteria bacterium]